MFGGTFLAIRMTRTGEPREINPWLFSMDESSIAHIKISYNDQVIDYDRPLGSISWMIQGEPDVPVFGDRWAGTPLLLSGPRVNRSLSETIENPSAYGLDPPETVVIVSDRSGQSIEFHLGIPTPDGENQYARLAGDKALYSVPEVWGAVINRLAEDPPFGQLYDMEAATIRLVQVSNPEHDTVYRLDGVEGVWKVEGKTPAPITSQEWADALTFLSGPRIDEILAYDIDDPTDYGLEPPHTRVVVARLGAAPEIFHLGDLTPDGVSRYVRKVDSVDSKLYAIHTSRLERIIALASDPPFDPSDEPGETPSG